VRGVARSGRGSSRTGQAVLQDAMARHWIKLRPPGFGVRLSSAAFLDAISAASSSASRSGRSNIEMLTTLCRRARSLARAADDLHQRLLKHKTFVQAAGYQQMVALEQQLHRADEFSLAVTLHLWQRFI
jgi:hypothetical protein